jgi:hypothetical protein
VRFLVGFGRVAVGVGGVLVGLGRMLLGSLVVAGLVMPGRVVVMLGSPGVVLCRT